ncbi:oxidoreductase [Plantactinospora sp. KBS50]|uniref:oxidoreductase n=1 Tax=Plantactinospora sp. KBS50 TaxID=2024580 RepID=UPI000BAB23F8|nr:oxidoreductase [Plantactinospora sp. KBS50]ASW53243.1 oxidoreductase [Plantactinospora sp. KBS50]
MTTDPLAPLLSLADVAPAVDHARDRVDQALRHRALRRQGGRVAAEVSLRCAVASAAIEGHGYDLDAVRAGTVTDPVVQGALRVAGELPGLADRWSRAPRQVLARLHVLAARDAVPADELGRPGAAAPGDRPPVSPAGAGPGAVAAPQVSPAGGPAVGAALGVRLDGLAALVAGGTSAPPVLLAAVVHGELLALRPFAGPSGVVARAAARLTLLSTGFDPRGLVAVDLGHRERQPEYVGSAGAFATGTPDGLRSWLRHYVAAVELGADRLTQICDEI